MSNQLISDSVLVKSEYNLGALFQHKHTLTNKCPCPHLHQSLADNGQDNGLGSCAILTREKWCHNLEHIKSMEKIAEGWKKTILIMPVWKI